MAALLLTEIKALVGTHDPDIRFLRGAEMQCMPILDDSWLLIEGSRIIDYGAMSDLPAELEHHSNRISLRNKYVLPAWCDSHTHLVFAESREAEFVQKIAGKSYEEIAATGGGILNSAHKVGSAPEEELVELAYQRMVNIIRMGTGAVEIKSGYGLTPESELKMLRVIRKLKELTLIPVVSTFLGAHAYPLEFRGNHEGYIRQVIDEMIPKIAGDGLADYIDVFCEGGFFSVSETSRILEAGAKYGLKPKIHANQLSSTGAVQIGVDHHAVSVDHLEMLDEAAIACLSDSDTIATLLPGCSLYLGIPFANARALINASSIVAVASDYNPGSSPSGNMNLVVSLACMRLKMTPEEAINAATINGAAAMGLSDRIGSITRGKTANVIITNEIPSLAYLPYSFGDNLIDRVILNGVVQI